MAGSLYRRSLALERGAAVAELDFEPDAVRCRVWLDDPRDLPDALARCRRMLDLDADPATLRAALEGDPLLGPLVRARPGLRVPGCADGFELAVRAVLGQQVTLSAARRAGARLVELYGARLAEPAGALTHLFPTPAALAEADSLALRLPRARAGALRSLARALLAGELELGPDADRVAAAETLLAMPGVGPWTVSYVSMRALRDPDAFPPGDAGVRRALERLGENGGRAAAERLAERWRPWRSYAVVQLWQSLAAAGAAQERAAAARPAYSRR